MRTRKNYGDHWRNRFWKSTFSVLMLRFYDIQEGQILLEETDIQNITQHELRERISYVTQKAFLFSGTITDNLRIGKNDATLEERILSEHL